MRAGPLTRPVRPEISRFPSTRSVLHARFSDPARSTAGSRNRRWSCCLPPLIRRRHPGSTLSRLNGWPAGSPADASSTPSRTSAHGLGPMWIATPSSQWTLTTYSLPVSRRSSKTSLNVHAHRGMHKHSTRCVHLRTTTPEMLLHPCTCVETGVHGALCVDEAHASISPWRCTCPCVVWPTCQGQCGRFAFSECSVVLVTARVHGWSSISGVVAHW
jgi:hypothetical protein